MLGKERLCPVVFQLINRLSLEEARRYCGYSLDVSNLSPCWWSQFAGGTYNDELCSIDTAAEDHHIDKTIIYPSIPIPATSTCFVGTPVLILNLVRVSASTTLCGPVVGHHLGEKVLCPLASAMGNIYLCLPQICKPHIVPPPSAKAKKPRLSRLSSLTLNSQVVTIHYRQHAR